jgi:hypothetical protein
MIYSTEFQSVSNKIWWLHKSASFYILLSNVKLTAEVIQDSMQDVRIVITCNFGWINEKIVVKHTLNILYSYKPTHAQLLKSSFKKGRSLCDSLTFMIMNNSFPLL